MNRICCLLLAIVLIFSLCACGKAEEAPATEPVAEVYNVTLRYQLAICNPIWNVK